MYIGKIHDRLSRRVIVGVPLSPPPPPPPPARFLSDPSEVNRFLLPPLLRKPLLIQSYISSHCCHLRVYLLPKISLIIKAGAESQKSMDMKYQSQPYPYSYNRQVTTVMVIFWLISAHCLLSLDTNVDRGVLPRNQYDCEKIV